MVVYVFYGFDVIFFVVKFGFWFIWDDNDVLIMLMKFLGEDVKKYMILLFIYGDDVEYNVWKKCIFVDEYLKIWIDGMVEWMKCFIYFDLEDRVVLFNCRLMLDEEFEVYKK